MTALGQQQPFSILTGDRLVTARSGRSLGISAILNVQFGYAEYEDIQTLQGQKTDAKGVAAATPEYIH